MDITNVALILEFLGEIIIALSVIRVHTHVLKEHRLDGDVFRTIKTEQRLLLFGLFLMFISYLIQIFG